jgi:WD40 repeat protein
MVLLGTICGVALLLAVMLGPDPAGSHLAKTEVFGTNVGPLFLGLVLLGGTAGALAGGIGRAYRRMDALLALVWVILPGRWLSPLLDTDWAPVRSRGWIWIGVSLALLAVAAAAAVLVRLGLIRRIPALVTPVAVLLGTAGAMVSCAVVLGLIGQQFAGHVGLELGETVGGLLGPLVGWITTTSFFYGGSDRRSWDTLTRMRKMGLQGLLVHLIQPSAPEAIRSLKSRHWAGLLISAGLANAGVLWLLLGDGAQGVEVRRLSSGQAFSEAVFGVAVTPDNRLAVSAEDPPLPLWNQAEAAQLHRFPSNTFAASGEALSFRGGGSSRLRLRLPPYPTIQVYDLASGRELRRLGAGSHGPVLCFAISPDGRQVLVGPEAGFERQVLLVPKPTPVIAQAVCVQGLIPPSAAAPTFPQAVVALRVAAAGGPAPPVAPADDDLPRPVVAIRSYEERFDSPAIWDIETGKLVQGFKDRHPTGVLAAAFSPNGRKVLAVQRDKSIRTWDVASGAEVGRSSFGGPDITCAAFSPDASQVVTGGVDGSVRLWNLANWSELPSSRWHRNMVTSVAFSPDGRRVLSGSEDWTVRLWDVDSDRQVRVYRGHTNIVHSVAFSADRRTALSGSCDGTVRVWQLPE